MYLGKNISESMSNDPSRASSVYHTTLKQTSTRKVVWKVNINKSRKQIPNMILQKNSFDSKSLAGRKLTEVKKR